MSTGNLLGGAAGGVAGYFAAGPLGISVGAGIIGGAIIGSLLGGLSSGQKMVMEYGKLSSRNWQGSEYGGDIPRGYGTFPATGSQIVWLEHNKLKEKVKKKKSGGKGGGGGTVTKTYSYYATFALMLCQGEVAGVRRIWCGDKLIYNAGSDDLETIIASNQAAKGWKLYRGTDDQLPDPRYEADVGVGNAPAFRGYTYIVFYDFALANYSNTLQAAQFKVELSTEKSDLAPKVLETVTLVDPQSGFTNLYQTAALHADENAGLQIFRGTGGTTAQRWKSSTTGYRKVGDPVGGVTGEYMLGEADFECVAYANYPDMHIKDGSGIDLCHLHIEEVTVFSWARTRMHIGGGYVYLVDNQVAGTKIFRQELSGSSTGLHELMSDTGPASPYGQYYDICLSPNFVFVITKTRMYLCLDYDFNVLWSVDLSSQADITVGLFSDNMTVLRARNDDEVILRCNKKFWSLRNSGYSVIGVAEDLGPGLNCSDILQSGIWLHHNNQDLDEQKSKLYFVDISSSSFDGLRLSDIVVSECSKSELISAADVDASLLTQMVAGYRVSGGTIRSVIEPLQGAYPFDVVPSGYKIKFVPRGQAPVVTIPWEDLAAANGDEIGDSLPYSREMDSQLPQKVTITALSSTREYGAATQSYERLSTSAVNVEQRDIPLVLSDDAIAQMAEKLLFLRWLERDDFSFSLPPTYLALEPADVVTVQAKFGTFELRQTDVNYESDGRLTCKAKANSAPLYTSYAVGAPGPGPDGTIPLAGESLLVPLDIPVIDETLQNAPGISTAVTGYNEGWPGAVLVQSSDSGQTYTDLQAYVGKATIGYARGTLPANSCALLDQRTLVVDLISGELEGITEDQMITGRNYAAYGKDGRWEIIRFQNAALQADGSYLLSTFIRGDKGTEWSTGLHQAGDIFVLLDDPDNAFVGLPIESLSIPRLYRAVTSGGSIDDADEQTFAYRGVNLKPLSPAYPFGARNAAGDLSASWTRRSRFSSSWWITGVAAPVGETSESYEVDVMSGSAVKRTITSTTEVITYTAVQQTADFGSVQASITLRIYQLSATVGRGYPLEVTL